MSWHMSAANDQFGLAFLSTAERSRMRSTVVLCPIESTPLESGIGPGGPSTSQACHIPNADADWDQGAHFDAACHPTTFASYPDSAECVRTQIICVGSRAKTDPWPDKSVSAPEDPHPWRAVVAYAQAEAIPIGHARVSQGIRCTGLRQFAPGCRPPRTGVVRAALRRSRRGRPRVLGQRCVNFPSLSLFMRDRVTNFLCGDDRVSSSPDVPILVHGDEPACVDAHDASARTPRAARASTHPRAHRPLLHRRRGPHPTCSPATTAESHHHINNNTNTNTPSVVLLQQHNNNAQRSRHRKAAAQHGGGPKKRKKARSRA